MLRGRLRLCEIKNINSFRNIIRAIEYESQRQVWIRPTIMELPQQNNPHIPLD